MDFFDLMSISHRYMEILNPSTPEKIIKLGKLLKLKKGYRVIDFGCGCAGPLTLWAEEFGITGIGIDISEDFCDRARQTLDSKGLSDRIEIVIASDHITRARVAIGAVDILDLTVLAEHLFEKVQ